MYERSQPALEDARRLLDEVIELDPRYAPAYAERGIVAMLLGEDNYGEMPVEEAQRQGKRFIDLALELDPNSAEGLAGLGLYYVGQVGRTDDAIAALERSLEVNPNQLEASLWLATALEVAGDVTRNLAVLEDLTTRDPLFRPAFSNAVFAFEVHGMPDKAEALIERMRRFDPNDQVLIQAQAVHAYFAGDIVEGLRFAEAALERAPNSQQARSFFAGGLRQTHQFERLAELEQTPLVVDALDALGRRGEAFELAYAAAASRGEIVDLFNLFKRAGRDADLVAYLEERWPDLDAFAREYGPDSFGYPLMLSVAHAYARTGDLQQFSDAATRYAEGVKRIRAQGVDHRFLTLETAVYHAVTGDYDAALDTLESLAGKGMFVMLPLAKSIPEFRPLQDDLRFVAIEERMLEVVNGQRAEFGLDPVDPANQFWQYDTP